MSHKHRALKPLRTDSIGALIFALSIMGILTGWTIAALLVYNSLAV